MNNLHVRRFLTANGATLGLLTGLSKPIYTLEDEWRGNQRQVSCIPTGSYQAVPHGWEPGSPVKFKQVWRLLNVPGRSDILIHVGNSHKDTLGCLLVGLGMQVTQTQSLISDSRLAIELMRREIGKRGFTLVIE